MSKFMQIAGILFIAFGIALGLMVFFSPGQMQVVALTPDVAAIFLVGGVLSLGLGGVIAGLADHVPASSEGAAAEIATLPKVTEETVIPPYGRIFRNTRPADKTGEELSPSVRDTITALENARTDIHRALGDEPKPPEPLSPPVVEPEPHPEPGPAPEPEPEPIDEPVEEEAGDTPAVEGEHQLYVVEEKMIRARPARILSDGTVEAETEEGWMRFENLEHLDEYLDAMAPAAKA